jgi:hypothetical protein
MVVSKVGVVSCENTVCFDRKQGAFSLICQRLEQWAGIEVIGDANSLEPREQQVVAVPLAVAPP